MAKAKKANKLKTKSKKKAHSKQKKVQAQLIKEVPTSEEFVETGIDKLYSLVLKKQKISTDEAAKILRLKKETVEEWAQILSNRNLIKLNFSILGKTIMEKKEEKD